jgi:hypothetical protein
VQTRTVQKDFNESQTLAFLIYSNFLFVVIRLIMQLLSSGSSSTMSAATLSGIRSVIFSVDTMATIIIYFLPKFLESNVDPNLSLRASFYGLSNYNISGATSGGSGTISSNKVSAVTANLIQRQTSSKYDQPNSQPNLTHVTEIDTTEASSHHELHVSITCGSMNLQSDEVIKEENEFNKDADNDENNTNHHDDGCDDSVGSNCNYRDDNDLISPTTDQSDNHRKDGNNDPTNKTQQLPQGVVPVVSSPPAVVSNPDIWGGLHRHTSSNDHNTN